MEAFPRTDMMAPELKDPEHPFPMTQCNKIKAYIAMHYQNDPNNFNAAFSELDDMRSKMLQGTNEHELVCVLKRYYAQLTLMKNRFPMELDGDASIQFAWTERSSDNALPIVIPDIQFEICCVMFNIGCLHAIIAASQQRGDDDGSKTAFMHFQQAAWPFISLRDELNANRCGLVDFDSIALTFYANVMLAQAQECLLEKSLTEGRSPAVICKIAYRIFQLYNSCGNLINQPSFVDIMPSSRFKNWFRLCSIKAAIYGTVYFHARGQDFSTNQKYGAALACFKAGLDLANECLPIANKDKRTSFKEALIYVKDVIAQREQIARKENDLIYHERIPATSELEEIKGVDLVKALSFKPTDPSIAGEDLFKELLPSSVVEVVSLYEEAKAELRRSVLNRCEKMDNELESYLLTLKLDRLNLDQPGEMQRLPDELISCYGEFNSQPDCVHNLLEKFHELTTKTSNVDCQLSDLTSRMRAVTSPQLVSSGGYKAFTDQLNKFTAQHKQARANNAELQKRLDTHTDNLKLFALSLPELTNEVSGKVIDTSKAPEGQALRRLLDKVDEMRKQRIRLIADLRDALDKDDITSHALFDPYGDPKPIIKTQLANHDKAVAVIDQNLAAQANILKALTEANANFADFRQQILDTFESKKSKAITLVTAFEAFKQIRSNTDKAINFYDNMLRLLTKLGEGVQNMEHAKKREDDEQRILMEKEQAKLQSLEVAEFVNEFSAPRNQQRPQNYIPQASGYSSLPQSTGMPAGRPKLGDYLRNRNKGAPVSTPNVPASAPQLPPDAQPPFSQPNFSQPTQPGMNPQLSAGYQMPISQQQTPPMSYQQMPQQFAQQYPNSTIPSAIPQSTPYVPQMSQPIMSTSQHNPQMNYQYPSANQANVSQSNQPFASTSQPPQSTYYQANVSAPTQSFVHNTPAPQNMVPQSQFQHVQAPQLPQSQVPQNQFQPTQFVQAPQNQHQAFYSQPTPPISQYQVPQSQFQTLSNQVPQSQTPQTFYSQTAVQPQIPSHTSFTTSATNGSTNSAPNTYQQQPFSAPSNGNYTAPQNPTKSAQNELDDFLFGGQPPAKPTVPTNGQPQSSTGFQSNYSPMSQQNYKPTNGASSPWHTSTLNPLLMNRNKK